MFKLSTKGSTLEVKSKAPVDQYHAYLHRFLKEVSSKIKQDKLQALVSKHLGLTSWRHINREVRKECDQYCAQHNIMTHAEFQTKWFYEGKMMGRVSHGRNAEWIGGTKMPVDKTPHDNFEQLYANKDPWAVINYPIFRRINNSLN